MFLIDGMIVIMENAPSPFLPPTLLVHETSFSTSPRSWRSFFRVPSTGSSLGKGGGSVDHGGGGGAPLAHITLQGVSMLSRVTTPPCVVLSTLGSSLGVDGARLSSPWALVLG